MVSGSFWVVSGSFSWFQVVSTGFRWFKVVSHFHRYALQLALSIILKERWLCESKHFCFFPNFDNRFLTVDSDLSKKYKEDTHLYHEI